ncbi:hypothetical protein SGLAM104S_02957 [Streptomyces glaucescens]
MITPAYPPKPSPGDRIAVISPASGLPGLFPLPYELGLQRLREVYGLEPVEYPATRKTGATPRERADDVHAAFADPDVKAVIATIGGDDQITVLPLLDRELIRAHPKPFIGMSDNTNLLAFLRNTGIVGYHGASVMVELGRPGAMNPQTADSLRAALFTSGPYELRPADRWNDVDRDWAEPARRSAEVVRDHWRLVLLTAGALAAGYAIFYAVTTWSLSYATERLEVGRSVMLACVMAAVVIKGALTPVAAVLGDRYGRRPMCLAGSTAAALWMFPMVALLATGAPLLMFLGFLGAMLAFITVFAVIAAYLPELYEPRVRCTGAAVGYNLGGVLGGALTPIAATALAEQGGRVPWGVGAYLTGIALLSLGCFALLPETRPAPAAVPKPAPVMD